MAKKKPVGPQLNALVAPKIQLPQVSFDLKKQDQFIQSHSVTFEHYRAMPSPIGLKDIGEYRRPDALDTLQENGMLYRKCGEFEAVLFSNSARDRRMDGGVEDESTARITLPRYYNKVREDLPNEEIHLAVGDRIFIKDMDVKVTTYQRVEYSPELKTDLLQYPALKIEFLVDSRGTEYKEGVDFSIDNGNIKWNGNKVPGVDPETGKGRIYSIRYLYNAHWYIVSIINEIRVGNVTENGVRKPSRMPYHAMIQREYVYHNKARPDAIEGNKNTITDRTIDAPEDNINPEKYEVRVNVNKFE
jgi:hypothetical protein